jgi:tetratricopeptide (TPR) repeat protein
MPTPEALIQQAQAAFARNALDECEHAGRAALKLRRDHPDALRLLGLIALRRNNPDDAAAFLARELAQRPRDPDAHAMLAKARLAQDRPSDAIALCDKALALRPADRVALHTKAKALLQAKRKGDALALLEQHAATPDAPATLLALHAGLTCNADTAPALADRLTAALDRAGLSPGDRLHLLYALGAAHHALGRHGAAFDAWLAAKACIPAPYDRAAAEARTESIIRFFSRERLASAPRADRAQGERLCFIVGMPRTGSTLLERILDAHPDAVGLGESTWLPDLAASLPATLGSPAPFPTCLEDASADALTRIARAALNKISRTDRKATLLVDKNLANHRHIGLIALLFPGARVIHCDRDPRAVALSCLMQNLSPLSHPYTRTLPDLAHAWAQCRRLMDHWLALADTLALRLDEIRYEDFVAGAEASSRALLASCNLPWHDACSRFFQTDRAARTLSMEQVREPMHTRAVERWKHYEAQLEPFESARRELLG